MRYRMCSECSSYAMARLKVGHLVKLLCLDCLAQEDSEWSLRRYICSVKGCENAPVYLAVIGDESSGRSLMVCENHFKTIEPDIKTYLFVPEWLTSEKDIKLNEEGVIIQMETTTEDDNH